MENKFELGIEEVIGSKHYRAFVGPPEKYDTISAHQFNLLTSKGLREHHYLLDIGCGSLRSGRLFIPYLLPKRYFGIEPEQWLIDEGIKNNLGQDLIKIKSPSFNNNSDFLLSIFNQNFDYILAYSIFSHATKNQIIKCITEASKIMKDDSKFFASFFMGNKNHDGDKWVYPGKTEYTIDFIKNIAENQGLECEMLEIEHPTEQTWIEMSKRKEEK
jgi:hypothetical protein